MAVRKILICAAVVLLATACSKNSQRGKVDTKRPYVKISLSFDSTNYPWLMGTKYPQMALWVVSGPYKKTIFVTEGASKKNWFGADERPSSLPVWYGIGKEGTSAVDAVTGATPGGEVFNLFWQVPEELKGKKAALYLEANVSFDYNSYYKKELKKGDAGFSGVNGQPSIIWKGQLNFGKINNSVTPEIAGRGDVLGKNHRILKDLSRVTSAKKLFNYIRFKYYVRTNIKE